MLYYECHITMDPYFDEDRDRIAELIQPYKFKLADLLLQKRAQDTPERSRFDTFCTAKAKPTEEGFTDIHCRMASCIVALQQAGIVIRRYKIEAIILDTRL